ncbi:MAG: hypothetical protein ACK5LE_06590 [Alphaproteobacteria bacterium]
MASSDNEEKTIVSDKPFTTKAWGADAIKGDLKPMVIPQRALGAKYD